MLTSIRRFLTAPVFEDEEKTRNAFLLHTLSLLILLILTLSVLLSPVLSVLVGASMNFNQVISLFITRAGFLVLLAFVTLGLTRAGYVRPASMFFVLAAWLMVTNNVYRSGGVLSLAFINYLLPIILAGLFLGIRPAIIYSTLSFVAGGTFFYLSNHNQLPAYEPLTPFASLIFGGVSFSLVALIISLYVRRLKETLDLLQNANQQLESVGKTLEKRVEERTHALASSAEISRRLSTLLNPEQLMLAVVEQIQTAYNYYHGQIYLLDKSKQTLLLAGATGEVGKTLIQQAHHLSITQGLVGKAARTKKGWVVPDVSQEPDWHPNPLLPATQAEIVVPILLGNELLGVLDMQASQVNQISEEDLELLQAIANQVAIALQNTRQYEETQTLFQASQALA
ncbi:MAG TPA: GAF domain-containing protein, partial [Anaerolineales bacterium]|nr:GAF domain-containing protein [Anaerolineales bacterium]